MKSQDDLHDESSETPPSSSNLQPKEQKLKDVVMKLFISRCESSELQAQKIKLIEENISSFFPAVLENRPTHPPYATMVIKAITEMNEGGVGGSNVDEISKYIQRNYHQELPFAHSHFLKHYLKKLVDSGKILYSYSNASYALPDLDCKPNPERRERDHEQNQKKKRNWGRLRKKYAAADDEEGDSVVDSSELRNSPEENFVVAQTESIQLCPNNNEDSMELGKNGEKRQQDDYSNIVIGLEANTLQQQQQQQQETVEQHHQSSCAKLVLETGKRRGRGRPPKVPAQQQEVVEQYHHNVKSKPVVGVEVGLNRQFKSLGRPPKMPVKQDTTEPCNPNGDSSPVDETEEGNQGTLQKQPFRGRGRPRKIDACQKKIVEQHHQHADSTPVVKVELGLLQKPCQGRPLGMQMEHETVEQRYPTGDSNTVAENEGGSSQRRQSKVNIMKKKLNPSEPSPPQEMSEVMQQTVTELGGTTPVYWLFEKTLTMSDVKRQQARIFISRTVKDLLTPAESRKYWVLKGDDDKSSNRNKKQKKEHTVTLVEPDGKTSEIDFKIWGSLRRDKNKRVVGEGQPVLTGSNWNGLVGKYSMEAGTKLQFWCFRNAEANELCFAMNKKV